jgi:hypothetical protein
MLISEQASGYGTVSPPSDLRHMSQGGANHSSVGMSAGKMLVRSFLCVVQTSYVDVLSAEALKVV